MLQGIAPTLMIVRVGLGASIDSLEASVAAAQSDNQLRFGHVHSNIGILHSPAEISVNQGDHSVESVGGASAEGTWK